MHLSTRIKQLIYPAFIITKANRFQRKRMWSLFNHYRDEARKGNDVITQPVRLFSNMEEDGIILRIIALLGIENGTFVDIGSNDCINSNCANLALNLDWEGVFIDGDQRLLNIGRKNYNIFNKVGNNRLRFVHSFVTPGNINELLTGLNIPPSVDFISIDIDGNDYAIFEAITAITPKLIVIENKIEYGHHDIVIGEDDKPHFKPEEMGASAVAMTRLAAQKGYTLIAANKAGFNTFYLRNDLLNDRLKPLLLEEVLNDPSVSKDFYDDNIMSVLIRRKQQSMLGQ